MTPIRVLLVEDHTLVRRGLMALLATLPEVVVVGEAADGRAGVLQAAALAPDVVLMDIDLPELNGLQAARQIAQGPPPAPRVIMLSMHTREEYVWQALQGGARGYLLKAAEATELALALHTVMRGEVYLSPAVAQPLVSGYLAQTAPGDTLTPRQREILRGIAEGQTSKAMAARLGVSVKTIETHRAQLMDHLDIHEVAGLVRYAIRIGLISADS
jgi:DNA-binding NarL/FixJ family response regulator